MLTKVSTASEVVDRISRSPVYRDYVRRMVGVFKTGVPRPSIHTVEDVLGERAMFAMMLANLSAPVTMRQSIFTDERRVEVAEAVLDAVPFLWRDGVREEAQNMILPEHVVSADVLPYALMWWTYESGAAGLNAATGEKVGMTIDAALIVGAPTGIHVITFLSNDVDGEMILDPGFVEYGTHYPVGMTERMARGLGQTLGMLAFLNSPYIPVTSERMSSSLRKTFRREGLSADEADTEVRFVDLRADPVGASHDGHVDVRWRSRWLVRGHVRNQWYPSTREHKLIYVPPYVKGPADLPLREPAYRVAR